MTARIEQVSSPEINTWIVGDDDEVIVIDPGGDPAGVLDAVGDREVLAVICTHGHPDRGASALEVFASQLTAIGESLLTLPPGTGVLPGHGEETTIAAAEKNFDSWAGAGL